jgi:hypothetical protein
MNLDHQRHPFKPASHFPAMRRPAHRNKRLRRVVPASNAESQEEHSADGGDAPSDGTVGCCGSSLAAIPAEDSGSGRWSVDHLFVDQEGLSRSNARATRACDVRLSGGDDESI